MKVDNQAGWYALFLSITQNMSPSKALSVMEGRRSGPGKLPWEEFLRVCREGEERWQADHRKYRRTDNYRAYQRKYRSLHPTTAEQRRRRAEYMRKYRLTKKHQGYLQELNADTRQV